MGCPLGSIAPSASPTFNSPEKFPYNPGQQHLCLPCGTSCSCSSIDMGCGPNLSSCKPMRASATLCAI